MINTSPEYKQALNEKRRFVARASCLLKNGTVLDFDKTNLMAGGIKIADGVSGTSKFEVGTAIINQLTIMVFNGADAFSDYDFTDAVLTVWVGMPLDDRIEWLKKGVFNATDPTTTPGVITLKALDNMSKFDQAYDGGIGFPSTLQSIVQYCCTQCGVLLVNGEFPNFRYQINKNPFTDTTNITYRAIIAYCALLAGCYARCNVDGRLEFKWFDTAAFDGIIDGGVFDETTESSYQTGANLDGGNFTDYSSGDTADGGTFTDALLYHHIYSFSSLSVSTEDVVITGIRVTAADSEDTAGKKIEGETYLCGAEGYVLDVSGNPLIEAGKAKDVAEYLAGRVVGLPIWPFQASAIGDPSWEAGDAAVVTDRKGNSYYTYLTNITYSTGGYASISCDAEPAARHSADRYAEINKIVADIKKDSQQKLTEYGKMLEQMNNLAINAMGYYETQETQDDGSVITYMHDKPILSESKIVYKQSIDGFFWSKDGGKTWTGGIDKDGNAVMNVIAAIGLYADWIIAGKISSKNGRVYFDLDSNELVCSKLTDKTNSSVTIGGVSYANVVAMLQSVLTGDTQTYGLHLYKEGFENYGILFSPAVNDGYSASISSGGKGLKLQGALGRNGTPSLSLGYATTFSGGTQITVDSILAETKAGSMLWITDKDVLLQCGAGGFLRIRDDKRTAINGGLDVTGTFTATGAKSRIADTENYDKRLLYCYETPTPYFGDIGTGRTDENGICYVSIDDIFQETVNVNVKYSVFLQKEGRGELWVEEKSSSFFVVQGTPNLSFSWEIKVVQKDYEYMRLEDYELQEEIDQDNNKDLQYIFEQELVEYDMEMEELLNENFEIVPSN